MGAWTRHSRITVPVVSLTLMLMTAGAAPRADVPRSAVPANPDDKTIIHVLNRIGFGPLPGDLERVRKIGLAKYIDQQLHAERLADTAMTARLSGFTTLTKSTRELSQDYFMPALMERRRAQQKAANDPAMQPNETNPDGATKREMRTPEQVEAMQAERQVLMELNQQKMLRAAYSERQLEEVMVDFWFNHFNVFAGKGQTRTYLTEYERDTIRPRVLGNFRDLLGAVAESPAMLFYLDNWQSAAPEGSRTQAPAGRANLLGRGGIRPIRPGQRGRLPIGDPRAMANLPPRPNQRARGLNENYARELMELHTLGVDGGYTQKDVQEVARALTGWTIGAPRQGGGFQYEPRMHDDGEKSVLGHTIKSGGGKKDGEQVLDILASHPSTAQFIATKLARRFVADQPPKALVDRAAARFRDTRGDIREVVQTIITSPEFFAAEAYRAKVKTPFEFVVSAVRATGVDTPNAMPLVQAVREMGMPLYGCQPPTGYADRAEAWVNTGALLSRMNFAVALTSGGGGGGGRGPLGDRFPGRGRAGGFRPMGTLVTRDLATARDAIIEGSLAGDISEATRSTVGRATQTSQVVALLLGSPEFQKR